MLTLTSDNYSIVISGFIVLGLLFLTYIFLIKEQDTRLNWAMLYSTLYVCITLPIVNNICVSNDLWNYSNQQTNTVGLPVDLFFMWTLLWAIVPVYFLKTKYILPVAILILWIDILVMPLLADIGIISLSQIWLLGEVILIVTVFAPAYFWAYCSYNNQHRAIRASFQVICMALLVLIAFPYVLSKYGLIESLQLYTAPFTLQILIIIVFPSLVAVVDLVTKGKGTPFPYDPTSKLVLTGVYAYCRNPIQWSFTLLFIPLSMYYSSYYVLLGSIFSIAYSYGVSDFQEYADMEKRFGSSWLTYKKNVPKWRFLWRPSTIPRGTVYFDYDCNQCCQIRDWFIKSLAINLDIRSASEFSDSSINQVTYIDHNGLQITSVKAIASCLEHINLAYATLGWFMRFPLVNQVLQLIINTMDFSKNKDRCHLQ